MTTATRQVSYWELLYRYSSITKLFRITTICRRIISCMRNLPNSSPLKHPLTPLELEQSHRFWVCTIQKAAFSHEIEILSRNERLPKSNPLVRLTPYLDQEGLFRVGGRLNNAQIDADSKHPFILPRKSPLVTLIIDDAYKRMLHGGTQVTLNFIRRTY